MNLNQLLTKNGKRFVCFVFLLSICAFMLFGFFVNNGFTIKAFAQEVISNANGKESGTNNNTGCTNNNADGANGEAGGTQAANFTNLIVFIKFNGESEFVNDLCGGSSSTVTDIVQNCYTKAEYCVSDYYLKASNGKVKMQNLYLFGADGGSLTLSKERGYYCSNQTNNPIGYEYYEYSMRMYELKQDWSAAITSAISGGAQITNADKTVAYDLSQLDKNGDGYVDSLTVIYKYSDKYSVAWSDCLWNYQDFYSGATFSDGKNSITSGAYLQITANFNYLYSDANGLKFASLKTMIHEMGHIFGLKDLYRSETNSRVYYMSAMSNAISPIPQYISSKEREALGWLDKSNIAYIDSAGEYTVNVTSSQAASGIVCYKINVGGTNKTLYLEYRDFTGFANKYDRQEKIVYNANGNIASHINLKSGLVCFLADKDINFPNNLNTSGSHWSYEVLGGQFATKVDAALQAGESLTISQNLSVEVIALDADKLTFRIVGNGIDTSHSHAATKNNYKAATCIQLGNIEYWYCSTCNQYFADEQLKTIINKEDTVINYLPHSGTIVKGKQPTCSTYGFSDGERCKFCNKVLVAQQQIEKLAHTPSDWIIDKQPTALENGQKHKECLKCSEVLASETIIYQDDSSGGNISGGNDGDNVDGGGDKEDGGGTEKPPVDENPPESGGNDGNDGDNADVGGDDSNEGNDSSGDNSGEDSGDDSGDDRGDSSGETGKPSIDDSSSSSEPSGSQPSFSADGGLGSSDYYSSGCKSNFSSCKILSLIFILSIAVFIKKQRVKSK